MIEHEQASWKISPIQATQAWSSPCSMEIRMKSCIEVVSQMQLTDMMKLSVWFFTEFLTVHTAKYYGLFDKVYT